MEFLSTTTKMGPDLNLQPKVQWPHSGSLSPMIEDPGPIRVGGRENASKLCGAGCPLCAASAANAGAVITCTQPATQAFMRLSSKQNVAIEL